MYKRKKVTAIILCAGSGTRFNSNINKIYQEVKKKPLIIYSIEKFINNLYVDEIILVIKKEEEKLCKKIIRNFSNLKIVYGGEIRKDSVYNALNVSNGDIVIIHDGARPLLTNKMINECIEQMDYFKAVTIGVKSKDTIKITDDSKIVINTTLRKNTWVIQTPQCFDKKLLKQGHESEFNNVKEITDDCMIMEFLGYKVKIIEGEYTNIKVTVKEDIELIERFMNL